MMDKYLYPTHPVHCIITGPSECGKSVFLTNINLNIFKEFNKIYIYSPSLHQDLYQKIIKCFGKYIPFDLIPNLLNEEDIDVVIEEIVNNKDFGRSDTELETFDSIEEIRFPQDYENNSISILDEMKKKLLMIKYKRRLNEDVIIIYQYS